LRCCVQRVKKCAVDVNGSEISSIGRGLLIFIGIAAIDTKDLCDWLAKKISNVRIFEDDLSKMSKSLLDVGGSLMVVSQFTLLGDVKKGRRPDFMNAMDSVEAKKFYEYFIECCKKIMGDKKVQTGIFGENMEVRLINDGPVTLVIDHHK